MLALVHAAGVLRLSVVGCQDIGGVAVFLEIEVVGDGSTAVGRADRRQIGLFLAHVMSISVCAALTAGLHVAFGAWVSLLLGSGGSVGDLRHIGLVEDSVHDLAGRARCAQRRVEVVRVWVHGRFATASQMFL